VPTVGDIVLAYQLPASTGKREALFESGGTRPFRPLAHLTFIGSRVWRSQALFGFLQRATELLDPLRDSLFGRLPFVFRRIIELTQARSDRLRLVL
jgi:hypothetical protein